MKTRFGILKKGLHPKDLFIDSIKINEFNGQKIEIGELYYFKAGDYQIFFNKISFKEEIEDFKNWGWGIAFEKSKTNTRIVAFKQLIVSNEENNQEKIWSVFTFEDCSSLIRKNNLVKNAGFKIICNYDYEKLKSEKSKPQESLISGAYYVERNTGTKRKEQYAKNKKPEELEIKIFDHDLKSISFKTKILDTKQTVTIGELTTISFKNGLKDLENIQSIIIKNLNKNHYIKVFPEIDSFEYINEKEILEKLNDKLLNEIITSIEENDNEIQSFAIYWTGWLHEEHAKFKFPGKRSIKVKSETFEFLENQILQKYISKKPKNIEMKFFLKELFEVEIESQNSSGETLDYPVAFKKCLTWECELNNQHYVLKEGEWAKVEKDLSIKVEEKYHKLSEHISEKHLGVFPLWESGKREDKYNEELAEEIGAVLIDKENVIFGRNKKLEIGDIFIQKDNAIFAIKMAHSSSNISHLISQVKNARTALIESPGKISEQLNKKLAGKKTNTTIDFSGQISLIVAIASPGNSEKEMPKIPFFAKMGIIDLFENTPNYEKIDLKIMSIQANKKKK